MPANLLLVLGGAETVWEDLERAQGIVGDTPHDIGAVNEAARDYPGRLTLMASLHPEKVGNWQRQRKNAGRNDDYLTISHKDHADARIDRVFREIWAGSSGLYICTTAIFLLGYERVIVCGVPMDSRPHYHNPNQWRPQLPSDYIARDARPH